MPLQRKGSVAFSQRRHGYAETSSCRGDRFAWNFGACRIGPKSGSRSNGLDACRCAGRSCCAGRPGRSCNCSATQRTTASADQTRQGANDHRAADQARRHQGSCPDGTSRSRNDCGAGSGGDRPRTRCGNHRARGFCACRRCARRCCCSGACCGSRCHHAGARSEGDGRDTEEDEPNRKPHPRRAAPSRHPLSRMSSDLPARHLSYSPGAHKRSRAQGTKAAKFTFVAKGASVPPPIGCRNPHHEFAPAVQTSLATTPASRNVET